MRIFKYIFKNSIIFGIFFIVYSRSEEKELLSWFSLFKITIFIAAVLSRLVPCLSDYNKHIKKISSYSNKTVISCRSLLITITSKTLSSLKYRLGVQLVQLVPQLFLGRGQMSPIVNHMDLSLKIVDLLLGPNLAAMSNRLLR